MSAAVYRKLLREVKKIAVPPVCRSLQRNLRTCFELQGHDQLGAAGKETQLKAAEGVLRWLQHLPEVHKGLLMFFGYSCCRRVQIIAITIVSNPPRLHNPPPPLWIRTE